MHTFQLIPAEEYAAELVKKISHANQRVVICAMVVGLRPYVRPILDALLEAARRGVKVHVVFDRYSYLPFAYDRLTPTPLVRTSIATLEAFCGQLEASGGRVSRVGKKWAANPFARRMHAKISIVDDTLYSFGGVNLDSTIRASDYMLRATNEHLCERLEILVQRIAEDQPFASFSEVLAPGETLHFDGGVPGDSAIYTRACTLASEATHIQYVSQYCPTGKLASLLKGKATCYFNRPWQLLPPATFSVAFDQLRYGISNHYRRGRYIHAKYMLFEFANGSRVILSGSHNFEWRGVSFGTKEIALESKNEELYSQLDDFLKTTIR